MAVAIEQFDSRFVSIGDRPRVELRYWIHDAADEYQAADALRATAPTLYDLFGSGIIFLPRSEIGVKPISNTTWEGFALYDANIQASLGASQFEFSTGGGNEHITVSRQTVRKYPASAPGNRLIGWRDDGTVEGIDIAARDYRFSETHFLPDSIVTPTYKGVLNNLTRTVNRYAFRELDPGECLLLGVHGAKRGAGDWELQFDFAGRPNESVNIPIVSGQGNPPPETLTEVTKKGWEYLWESTRLYVNDATGEFFPRITAVYIEQVYEETDFSQLQIGT